MKTLTQLLSLITIAAVSAGLLTACSQGETYNKSVDVKAMIQQLKSDDKEKRQDACIALGEAGPRAAEATAALAETLKDPESQNRSLAAYALGRIGPQAASALPALKSCLNDPNPEVTPSVINAIRAIDPKTADAMNLNPRPRPQ